MQTQQTPQVLAQPFAAQGDKNTIPNLATGTNHASLQEGFPPITSQPINKGGVPAEREDFNGAMNLNSQFYFAFQNGWWPTFTQEVSDAIGGYPQNAILCYFVPESNSVQFVRSIIPNNTYNFVTTPSYIGQYWVKCFSTSSSLPMGSVYFSQSSLTADNSIGLPLWTGEYYSNGSSLYPDFYAWVKSHTELCKTKTEYDAAISTYGECPYYVVDEVAGSLRLPKLVNYLKMANTTGGITQSGAGLPNFTGSLTLNKQEIDSASGAFSLTGPATQGLFAANGSGHAGNYGTATLDPSQSSDIYGNSDTVTPAHTTLYPWVVVNPDSASSSSQYILLSQIGTANGVASLDGNTKIPFAQMPTEITDNIEMTFDPSTYGWPDIRPAARPNAIVLMAGVKSDYSAYDNLGFVATCEGGYNVFIDGVQYGETYASGAQCSIVWSEYNTTGGMSVEQPQALTVHIVQIVPANNGNNISSLQSVRVSSSGIEEQGILWAHVNMSKSFDLSFNQNNKAQNPLLISITALDNTLKINSSLSYSFAKCALLQHLPVIDAEGRNVDGGSMFSGAESVHSVTLKNINFTNIENAFLDTDGMKKVVFENIKTNSCTTWSGALPSVKSLPNFDFTSAQNAANLFGGNSGNLNDIILDVGYADDMTRIGVSGINVLKEFFVSPAAPFNGTSPQIDVSYTGLDQNALAALFKSLPYNAGYSVTGSPTIQDGIVTNADSANSVMLPMFDFFSAESFDYVVKLKTGGSGGPNGTFTSFPIENTATGTKAMYGIYKYGDTLSLYGGFDAENNTIQTSIPFTANSALYVRWQKASGHFKSSYSFDGSDWTTASDTTSTVMKNYTAIRITPDFSWTGSAVDLNGTYITVNGVPYFRGTAAMDKTINITGATGAASLTAEQLAIATNKGWTVTR